MANAIMVMGTASDVGKSVITAGICRLLYRRGVRVAPFKAQNMSLNSFATAEGGEMGRAQVLQAQACGLLPHVDMNPILLKPENDNRSHVIVHGKVWGTYNARSYFAHRQELFQFVQQSYSRLAGVYDVIILEGAGSAAEINLRDKDLVNWPVAELADAAVLLVADIGRGGVFAQVIGTLDLLSSEECRRVIGITINKFRGDPELFNDGIALLEQRAKLPILGIIPFLRGLELDQEDSLDLERYRHTPFSRDKVNVAVVTLPRMSNFTDFNAPAAESDVILRYATSPWHLLGADIVIVPGSKNTIADLIYLEQEGFVPAIKAHVEAGGELVGICGGYQMLGREITDPFNVEGGGQKQCLGFLDVITELAPQKRTEQVEAKPIHSAVNATDIVQGYEIHMGQTRRGRVAPCFRVQQKSAGEDGAISEDHLVWGTYIHGVFDSPRFRRSWLNQVRKRKGLPVLPSEVSEGVSRNLSGAIDRWADHLEQYLNLRPVFEALKMSCTGLNNRNQVVTESKNW
jgi:adenosylcobyric acid synthase